MSRIADVLSLHPMALDRVIDLKTLIEKEGIPLVAYETVRSPWRQSELYARGRVTDGKKVTKARAWESLHQYGLGVVFVFRVGGNWTWDEPEVGMWDAYHRLARGCDLSPLSFEKPHVEVSWNVEALKKGHLPGGFEGSKFDYVFREWCERWGSRALIHAGLLHPGAPPLPDLDARPEMDGVV